MRAIPLPFSESTEKQKQRFWAKVKKLSPEECWPWTGAKNTKGYGQMTMNKAYVKSTRVGWMIVHGTDPFPMHVLHACDTRLCHNPDHWFKGTNKDNCQDKARKFRNGRKLTPEIVRLIKHSITFGSRNSVARAFGLSPTTVASIRDGVIWRHVLIDNVKLS
jgi:hypothetical protein